MEAEASRFDGNPPQATGDGTNGHEAAAAEDDESELLVAKAQSLMDTITAHPENPNPKVLHALSTILDTQEARYMEDTDHSSLSNTRSSHNIGRLGNLIRENDEFFDLISTKFLTENGYSISVLAATVRLLFCCSLTWTYPHIFEDDVLENIRGWVIDETPKTSAGNNLNWKHETKSREASDSEMLRTYSTGLLAVCLAYGGQLVEEVLASGLSAKLMRYLRLRVLGETSTSQRDANESKNASTMLCLRARDEGRVGESERDKDKYATRQAYGETWVHGEPHNDMTFEVAANEADDEEILNVRDTRESKTKPGGKNHREEELDDDRDDSTGRKIIRTLPRSRGKGRSNSQGAYENDQAPSTPGSGSRSGQTRSGGDRNVARNPGLRAAEAKTSRGKNNAYSSSLERDDNDDCYQECKVGSKDFTDLVKKAVRAAEAEARAANAPVEAIKAAGDDAAEVVKNAVFEIYKETNDEEAAVLAGSRAAETVVDAAIAVDLARSSNTANDDLEDSNPAELKINEDIGEYLILDCDSLAKLREKFSIQCLVILGEYVEVLGPVLHEKGVDVCLALLQRSIKHIEVLSNELLLPDILKQISALAAHKKFAAVFVDRGGMQKLLSAPRNAQTFLGLSSCLFTIGSIQGIMERVCALPSNVVHQVVELALQLLQCPQDQARKNAALFFAAAFIFRAVIEAFDAQDGLRKLLNVLHDTASVRSGVPPGPLNNSASLRSDRSPAEVLTSSEKQIAYHNCVALRQYFRAHLLLLVDSIRPLKNTRPTPRNTTSARASYKPLDISNEAMDSVFRQIQKDRKLGPAIARSRWSVVDKFLNSNGHTTMLELCQAPPVERYLHDLLQYALGVLHIVTLVPYSRKPIVNATVSNDRVGIAVILDAVNGAGHVEPEIVEPALNLLINLVCPPPSISNKSSVIVNGQQASSTQNSVSIPGQNEPRHRIGEPASVEKGCSSAVSTSSVQASGFVGDRRISLGAAGCAGLAAQLEQGYHQAREAVRSNNGIKILLQLLQPRMVTSPAALDCIRALTCRVLLGLARDDAIAHILTKLQVGKKLSELIRDSGSQTPGSQPNRWQAELTQVAIELIGVVTNSGRASTLAASDAATPTLRRIERAAIAAATPISYNPRELLLLIHEHLQASGLPESAATILREAKLTPLPSLAAPSSLSLGNQVYGEEPSQIQIQWPTGRVPGGFSSDKSQFSHHQDLAHSTLKKKPLLPSTTRGHLKIHSRLPESPATAAQSARKPSVILQRNSTVSEAAETPLASTSKSNGENEAQLRTPIVVPSKRKLTDMKETPSISSAKRSKTGDNSIKPPSFTSPNNFARSSQHSDANNLFSPPISTLKDHNAADENSCFATPMCQHGATNDSHPPGTERFTLDSIVVQNLKHQHRQCPAPITTLPPLSLVQPHVCPEPKRTLDAPSNVTSRLSTRQYRSMYGSIHGYRKDRQYIYSRFRPWRTCRDDNNSLLTCMAFLGNLSRVAVGGHSGELKIFDCDGNNVVESCTGHESSLTALQSRVFDGTQLLLSSSATEVRLWDGSSILGGPKHSFEGIKSARFSNSGSSFAALKPDSSRREILLYDVGTCQLDMTLTDQSNGTSARGQMYSMVHFCPLDYMLLYDGILWDRRASGPVHRFDQYTDSGGGGFHPAGNEVIVNSEVWDLRNFRLLRTVPSLDQTVITFNGSGDVIYAILRRNVEEVAMAFNPRRTKHPLFAAFRTIDAVNYSDIATIPVDRCVLDFATEPTDSFVGLITMDDQDEMYSSARVYEIGRRKPTDDDSDPDDMESDEEDEDDDFEGDDDSIMGGDLDVDDDDGEDDGMSNDEDGASDFDDVDGEFVLDGLDLGGGLLEIVSEGEDDDDDSDVLLSYSSGDDEDEDEEDM